MSEGKVVGMTSGMGMAGLPEEPNVPKVTEDMVPIPVGYNILVAMPEISDMHAGSSILRTSTEVEHARTSAVAVRVVDMGKDCYEDKVKFPTGPWCKIGDYILISAYAGTRFKVNGLELFRVITDDAVQARVSDPAMYSRI